MLSDNKTDHTKEDAREDPTALIHDFQNTVQKLSLELELALMDLKRRNNVSEVVSTIDGIRHSLEDLRKQAAKIARMSSRNKSTSGSCTTT